MKPKKPPVLSKSRFLAGLQCHLRLWYQCYERGLASEPPPARQAIFDTGHQVGRLATRLYPDGVLIEEDHLHHKEAVRATLKQMRDPSVRAIYEAAFVYDDVRIRADVLERLEDGSWNLVEVKSSTEVKDVYYPDVAVQYHVLKGCGLKISRSGLLHVNNRYVYDGKNLDHGSLFSFTDLTEDAVSRQPKIQAALGELKAMLAAPVPPAIEPSRHCSDPYECEFWDHCTKDKPQYWVFNLYRVRQNVLDELAGSGIEDIRDIPEDFPLNDTQQRIRSCVAENSEYISNDLKSELKNVEYPLHFLDFETIAPAIPRYAGTRPYQTLPFQWSDHILYQDGRLEHREYLCMEDADPRKEFVRQLLAVLGTEGSIVIYTSYETTRMRELAEHFPQYRSDLLAAMERIVDVHAIIRNNYYHPQFYGSFSIKKVLPAIVPEMSYENLAIQEGTQASVEYLRMIDPETPADEKAAIRADLLAYCGRDTQAMVEIRKRLLEL